MKDATLCIFFAVIIFTLFLISKDLKENKREKDITEKKNKMIEIEERLSKLNTQKKLLGKKLRSVSAHKERLLTNHIDMKRFGTFFFALTGSSFSPEIALRSLKDQIARTALLQSDLRSKIKELDAQIASLEGEMLSLHESLLRDTD